MASVRIPCQVALAESCYRLLLLTYPAHFRRTYGYEMAQTFRAWCRETLRAERNLGLLRLCGLTLSDLIATSLKEHGRSLLHRLKQLLGVMAPGGLEYLALAVPLRLQVARYTDIGCNSYYGFALKAALEAHNYDLWAASLGRMGLLLLSSAQPQQTLMLLEEAQDAPIQSAKIHSWHAAIEAEAYSYLGNSSACKKALERAKDTSEATFSETDIYATGFTRARLASYEGSCYLRLNQPEHALPVLEQALTLIDPTAIRRLSRLLTYLGETHIRLGSERQAYEYASQALDLTYQTQSLDILRHVRKLRDGFLTRGESSYTKDLDRRIEEIQAVIATVGRFHG